MSTAPEITNNSLFLESFIYLLNPQININDRNEYGLSSYHVSSLTKVLGKLLNEEITVLFSMFQGLFILFFNLKL